VILAEASTRLGESIRIWFEYEESFGVTMTG